jgi:serine/threonine protein phosphatase PrpC
MLPELPAPGARRSAAAGTRSAVVRTARLRRGPLVIGEPAPVIEPRLSGGDPYRPDTIADGGHAHGLTVRAASVRGLAKRYAGGQRQDDLCVRWHEPSRTLIAAVADGVSAAPRSHLGAALAVRHAATALGRQLDGRPDPGQCDWDEVFRCAAWALVDEHRRSDAGGDVQSASAKLATTLLVATVTAAGGAVRAQLAGVGDSRALMRTASGALQALGEPAADDGPLLAPATNALPRAVVPEWSLCHTLGAGEVLLLATDGFVLPLGDGTGQVGEVFARELRRPPSVLDFARLLDFSRSTYDDDRTLVAVWPLAEP